MVLKYWSSQWQVSTEKWQFGCTWNINPEVTAMSPPSLYFREVSFSAIYKLDGGKKCWGAAVQVL